jgi:predicted nucleic acid-binding Zn ribbon protein
MTTATAADRACAYCGEAMRPGAVVCTHCGRDRTGKQRRPGVSDEAASAPAQLAAGERACPWCAEPIKTAALVCKHCGKGVQGVTAASARRAPAMGAALVVGLLVAGYVWYSHPDREAKAAVKSAIGVRSSVGFDMMQRGHMKWRVVCGSVSYVGSDGKQVQRRRFVYDTKNGELNLELPSQKDLLFVYRFAKAGCG